METIRIFIASSSELEADRKAFRNFLAVENDRLHKKGVYLELVQWEHFLDAVSHTRMQEEYNVELKKCDIVVCLFFRKAGKYTAEEFETALQQFKETGKPLIYTYFKKDLNEAAEESLDQFKKYLADIGHFSTIYKNIDDLKYQFRKQLDRLEDKGIIPAVSLPKHLAENLITDDKLWVESIKRELKLKQKVSVGNRPASIFQYYGWLIEEFLRKMGTPVGRKRSLRRLSFMAEAFHGSLRYMCFIQMSQLLKTRDISGKDIFLDFFKMKKEECPAFDFAKLLEYVSGVLYKKWTEKRDEETRDTEKEFYKTEDIEKQFELNKSLMGKIFFWPIYPFLKELKNTESDLHSTFLFLEKHRAKLLAGEIKEDKNLDRLLDEYLTGLTYWLRKISFLAHYRLVSIKDINLKYRLGSKKNFVHLYGELHGIYSEAYSGFQGEDYSEKAIEGLFTYNHSVLLFNGKNVEACLEDLGNKTNYISLSPLIVDNSVFSEKPTQTPDIYYYTGHEHRQYQFAQFKNELSVGEHDSGPSNKTLKVKDQNISQPKLDELYEQMEQFFKPFRK